MLDYQGVAAEDLNRLDSYLQSLIDTEVGSLSRASQKPFWINDRYNWSLNEKP